MLTLKTEAGEGPQPASVTLIGVDEALSQLVTLPGPDDFAHVLADCCAHRRQTTGRRLRRTREASRSTRSEQLPLTALGRSTGR